MRFYAGKRVKAPVVGNCYVGTSFYIPKVAITIVGVIIALPLCFLFKLFEYLSNIENIFAALAILAIIGLMVYAAHSAWKNGVNENVNKKNWYDDPRTW